MKYLNLYKKYFSEQGFASLTLAKDKGINVSDDTKHLLDSLEQKANSSGLQLNVSNLQDPKQVRAAFEQAKQNNFAEEMQKSNLDIGTPDQTYVELKGVLEKKNSKMAQYFDSILAQIKSFAETVTNLFSKDKVEFKTEFQASLKLFIYGLIFVIVGLISGMIGNTIKESFIPPVPVFMEANVVENGINWFFNIVAYICKFFSKFNIIVGVTLMVIGGAGVVMSIMRENKIVD